MQAAMRSAPVAAVEQDRPLIGAMIGDGICLGIGPFALKALLRAAARILGARLAAIAVIRRLIKSEECADDIANQDYLR